MRPEAGRLEYIMARKRVATGLSLFDDPLPPDLPEVPPFADLPMSNRAQFGCVIAGELGFQPGYLERIANWILRGVASDRPLLTEERWGEALTQLRKAGKDDYERITRISSGGD